MMDAGCRDNWWTASLYTWPPGCSPLVLPPSQEMGSAWASLSLIGCKTQVKACYRKVHSLSRASDIHGHHKAFQITHLPTTFVNSDHATLLNTAHTVGLRCIAIASAPTAATILADAAFTPSSPKNLKCVEWDVKAIQYPYQVDLACAYL